MDSKTRLKPLPVAASLGLDELGSMQCATVSAVDAADGSASQLMAMGVCVGRQVEVVKRGDPLILRVLGSRIGVSARLAKRVRVVLCGQAGCPTPGPTPET